MAKNQTGIAITIKAFLPTGSTIDQQFTALSIVKDAHASGDYTALLKAAKVEEVKTEQKTRRVEDEPETTAEEPASQEEPAGTIGGAQIIGDDEPATAGEAQNDAEVPEFLKKGKGKAA